MMGGKGILRQSNIPHDASEFAVTDHEAVAGSNACGLPKSFGKAIDKQTSQRRKVDSVLDDIMGDPDDFKGTVDSDAESNGGRWEDSVRASHNHEEAVGGAVGVEMRDSEDGWRQASGHIIGKTANGTSVSHNNYSLPSPSCTGNPVKNIKGRLEKAQENEGCKLTSNALTVNSESVETKVGVTKYFVIKSLNHHNIAKSIEKGIWATQAMNEPVLNEAFETSEQVLLVFSVNMSGHFQGYAQMKSPIGRRRANVWSEANEGVNPWGGTFSVEWQRLYELPFQKTVHLKNPLNFFKPVKISRDCQELTQEVGDALCALIDEGSERDGRPKRKVTAADLVTFCSKRNRKETVRAPCNGGTLFPAVYHPTNISPGALHNPFSLPRVSGGGPSQHPIKGSRVSKSKSPRSVTERGMACERDVEKDVRHRECNRPLKRDRSRDCTRSNSGGHSTDLQVEDDLLNMTYEEYLHWHGGHCRDFNKGYHQGVRPPFNSSASPSYCGGWGGRNAGMEFPEDQYLNYVANWYSRLGPPTAGNALYVSNGMGSNYHVTHPSDAHWCGQPDDFRESRPGRSADGKYGQGYLANKGESSRHIERIAGLGS